MFETGNVIRDLDIEALNVARIYSVIQHFSSVARCIFSCIVASFYPQSARAGHLDAIESRILGGTTTIDSYHNQLLDVFSQVIEADGTVTKQRSEGTFTHHGFFGARKRGNLTIVFRLPFLEDTHIDANKLQLYKL